MCGYHSRTDAAVTSEPETPTSRQVPAETIKAVADRIRVFMISPDSVFAIAFHIAGDLQLAPGIARGHVTHLAEDRTFGPHGRSYLPSTQKIPL